MDIVKRIAAVCRFLDTDGKISITNILVFVGIYLVIFLPGAESYIVFMSVVGLYGFGRWLNFKRGQAVSAGIKRLVENQRIMQQQLEEQKNKITALSIKAGIISPIGDVRTGTRRF